MTAVREHLTATLGDLTTVLADTAAVREDSAAGFGDFRAFSDHEILSEDEGSRLDRKRAQQYGYSFVNMQLGDTSKIVLRTPGGPETYPKYRLPQCLRCM